MVSEHQSRNFAPELLSETFSWATFGNGMVAIGSGMMANSLVDVTKSFVSPFLASAAFLVVGGVVVYLRWVENYGERSADASDSGVVQSLKKGLRAVRSDMSIFSVGTIVALFESSMYTFVFLWGPVLEQMEPSGCKLI